MDLQKITLNGQIAKTKIKWNRRQRKMRRITIIHDNRLSPENYGYLWTVTGIHRKRGITRKGNACKSLGISNEILLSNRNAKLNYCVKYVHYKMYDWTFPQKIFFIMFFAHYITYLVLSFNSNKIICSSWFQIKELYLLRQLFSKSINVFYWEHVNTHASLNFSFI